MIFPEIAELEFDEEALSNDLPLLGKSFLYDYDKGDFVLRNGKLVEQHGKDVLKAWIEKIIRTERNRFKIYEGTDYGIGVERAIGRLPREILDGELERIITEKLTEHPYINDLENWEFEVDGRKMIISFTVITPDEEFEQEVRL